MRARIITANRLTDGAVVYLGPDARWSAAIEAASLAADAASEAALAAIAEDAVRARRVVQPYVIEVETEGARIMPLKLKELIRARGPSIENPTIDAAAPTRE